MAIATRKTEQQSFKMEGTVNRLCSLIKLKKKKDGGAEYPANKSGFLLRDKRKLDIGRNHNPWALFILLSAEAVGLS